MDSSDYDFACSRSFRFVKGEDRSKRSEKKVFKAKSEIPGSAERVKYRRRLAVQSNTFQHRKRCWPIFPRGENSLGARPLRETRAGRKGSGVMALEIRSQRLGGFRRGGASPRRAHAASRDPTNPRVFFQILGIPRRRVRPPATRDRDRVPPTLTPFPPSVQTRDREPVEPTPPSCVPRAELRAGVHVRRVSLGAPRDGVPPRRVPARPRARRVAGGGPPGARPELGEARVGGGEARARARPAGLPAGGEGWR